MRYFKRYWDEPRGPLDETTAWGCSWWHFEVDDAGVIHRQVEVFDNGPTLRYSTDHPTGKYGFMGDQRLDFDDFAPFEVTKDDFEKAWGNGKTFSATQS